MGKKLDGNLRQDGELADHCKDTLNPTAFKMTEPDFSVAAFITHLGAATPQECAQILAILDRGSAIWQDSRPPAPEQPKADEAKALKAAIKAAKAEEKAIKAEEKAAAKAAKAIKAEEKAAAKAVKAVKAVKA